MPSITDDNRIAGIQLRAYVIAGLRNLSKCSGDIQDSYTTGYCLKIGNSDAKYFDQPGIEFTFQGQDTLIRMGNKSLFLLQLGSV